eukprot:6995353-Prorocentrum_lima.AAC.1
MLSRSMGNGLGSSLSATKPPGSMLARSMYKCLQGAWRSLPVWGHPFHLLKPPASMLTRSMALM